jgi:hypothetical protein
MALGFGKISEKARDTVAAVELARTPQGMIIGAAGKSAGLSMTTTTSFNRWFTNNMLNIRMLFRGPYTTQGNTWKLWVWASIFAILISIGVFMWLGVSKKVSQGFQNQDLNVGDAALEASVRVDKLVVDAGKLYDNNDDYKLINLQPVCFKTAAYLGKDLFDSNLGILEQTRLGSRFFFFQIDYYENENLDKSKFGNSFEPVLIWRDDDKNLSSKNAVSLIDTFQSILTHHNNSSVPYYTHPILIMLHFVRLPYPKTDIDNYRNYMKKVSDALKVFKDATIKGYTRAAKEPDLFNNKYSDFNNSVIIGTNIDTTIYKDNGLELDKRIHFRYYVKETEIVDVTSIDASSDSVHAYIYNADTLLNIVDSQKQERWGEVHRNKFIIVKPRNQQTLSPEQVNILLNTFKVNVVLHDYFSDGLDNSKAIFKLYDNSCYKIKTTY